MVKNKKILISIICALSCIVIALAIICVFFPSAPKTATLQEQLDRFEASLHILNDTELDVNGHPAMRNIARSIIINENGENVAEYEQIVKIYVDNENKLTAYIAVCETYPTLETQEYNVFDEYYLSDNVMHTRRENDGDIVVSSFASNIDTLFAILFENSVNKIYNFSKKNFTALENRSDIIFKGNGKTELTANIKPDRYMYFFGDGADISGITDVQIDMFILNNGKLDSLNLTYIDGQQSIAVNIERHENESIAVPEWIESNAR